MRGNQNIINSQILRHEKNPIKEDINNTSVADIIQIITDEYWKEWRRALSYDENPYLIQKGLGTYKISYGKARNYMMKLIAKIRWYKVKYEDTWNVEGTRGNAVYESAIRKFRVTWKQVDEIKKEINFRNKTWRNKVNERYGEQSKYYKP